MVEMGLEPANKLPTGGGEYAMSHPAEVLAFTSDRRAHLVFPFGMTVPQWTTISGSWSTKDGGNDEALTVDPGIGRDRREHDPDRVRFR